MSSDKVYFLDPEETAKQLGEVFINGGMSVLSESEWDQPEAFKTSEGVHIKRYSVRLGKRYNYIDSYGRGAGAPSNITEVTQIIIHFNQREDPWQKMVSENILLRVVAPGLKSGQFDAHIPVCRVYYQADFDGINEPVYIRENRIALNQANYGYGFYISRLDRGVRRLAKRIERKVSSGRTLQELLPNEIFLAKRLKPLPTVTTIV